MIEGSDLDAAYAPLTPVLAQQATTLPTTSTASPSLTSTPSPQAAAHQQQPTATDPDEFHKHVEHKQRVMMQAAAYASAAAAQSQQAQQQQQTTRGSPSYFDQLWAKRRELMRMVQISMVIVLALSLHHVAKHALKRTAVLQQWSADRELFARAMYPLAIAFVLWNLRL